MIEEPAALTIKRPVRRPTARQIAAFQRVDSSFVVDAMFGSGALAPQVCLLGEGHDLDLPLSAAAGPALTVDNRPSDILALLGALDFIQKGDIIINGFAGFQGCAAAGDRVTGMMKNGGAAGFVTDGPMRDYAGLIKVGLPVWCTGLNPASPFATGPGKVGLPVQIAGQRVETGDMIVADRDGVVVVPFDAIDTVIERLAKVTDLETALDSEINAGLTVPDDIRAMLASDKIDWV